MAADFSGIDEKLKRANENIINLEAEVSRFIQECKYPIMPKTNSKEHDEALKYLSHLRIPLRFSVLAGEIVHHLRSILDHIIWELSDDATRKSKAGRFLEFPILEAKPLSKDELARYARKIMGVRHSDALKFIEKLQPYNSPAVDAHPFWLIQKMDVVDKHRELVVTHSSGSMQGPPRLMRQMHAHLIKRTPISDALKREFEKYGQITLQVSFREWRAQPIVPVLTHLSHETRDVVIQFKRIVT